MRAIGFRAIDRRDIAHYCYYGFSVKKEKKNAQKNE